MISFVAVLVLSFATLCSGTYIADRVERASAACAPGSEPMNQLHE